jgi:hypothetical protein
MKHLIVTAGILCCLAIPKPREMTGSEWYCLEAERMTHLIGRQIERFGNFDEKLLSKYHEFTDRAMNAKFEEILRSNRKPTLQYPEN